jgi:uncharacterized protein (DUF433 family)
MQLEDYFEFEKFDAASGPVELIRIKGHRIAVDYVINLFNQGVAAEAIVKEHYPTLDLEKVFATLAYYLHNKEEIDAYLKRGREAAEAAYEEWQRNHKPSPLEERLRQRRRQATDSGKPS